MRLLRTTEKYLFHGFLRVSLSCFTLMTEVGKGKFKTGFYVGKSTALHAAEFRSSSVADYDKESCH